MELVRDLIVLKKRERERERKDWECLRRVGELVLEGGFGAKVFMSVWMREKMLDKMLFLLIVIDLRIWVIFCGTLQQRYKKLPQYMCFSGISLSYSSGIPNRHNIYLFVAFFLCYNGGLSDHRNRCVNCLDTFLLLLTRLNSHFCFSFPTQKQHFPFNSRIFSHIHTHTHTKATSHFL